MVTRPCCKDLFEDFTASLVEQTKQLQIAIALRASHESSALRSTASTPLVCQASTPTGNATAASPVAAPRSPKCMEMPTESSSRTTPLSCQAATSEVNATTRRFRVTTPRSPRSLKMDPVPSPKEHIPAAACFGELAVLDMVEESLCPYTSKGAKPNRVVERWGRLTQEVFKKGATQHLAMLRSVWLLGQESHEPSPSLIRPRPPARTPEQSLRMGDISKYEQTFLNNLVLHPDNMFTAVYVCLIIVVAAYDLVSFPFIITFETKHSPYRGMLFSLAWISAAIWSLDIPMSFFQGFYTAEGVVEMRLGHTCLQYLKSWFLLDIVVNVADWITCCHMNDNGNGVLVFSRGLRVLRFFRLVRLLRAAERLKAMVAEALPSDYILLVARLLCLLLVILFISHYIACAWVALAGNTMSGLGESSWIQSQGLEQSDPVLQYTASLHWCLTQFTPATQNIAPTNGQERLFAIFVVIFGLVMFSTFVSSLTSAVVELKRMRSSRSAEEMQIRRYMKSKRVPLDICKQIWAYYRKQYRVRKRITTESTITFFHRMPAHLRNELHFTVYSPILSQHPVFEHCSNSSDGAVSLICGKAVTEQLIGSGQEVFSVGDHGACMYFFESGELSYACQLYDDDEKRIMAPQFIAEASLWTKWQHRGTLVGETPCDVLRVSADKLETMFTASRCLFPFDLVHGLRKYAALYANRISDCDNDLDWSRDPITDLMVELEVLSAFASKAFTGSCVVPQYPSDQSKSSSGVNLSGGNILDYFRMGTWGSGLFHAHQ